MPPAHRSGYGVLPHFTRSLMAAVQRRGIDCRLLGNEDGPTPNLIPQLLLDPPDCTVSFNGLLPDQDGKFLCDSIEVPHVACLVDSPNKFLSMVQSPLNILTCVDKAWADFFRGLRHDNTFFMAHAVDVEFDAEEEFEKDYDAVFLGTCLDIEERRRNWQREYPEGLGKVLDAAVEIALGDQTTSYMEAFSQAMDARLRKHGDVDPSKFNYSDLFDDLEVYIRGKDRIELLRAMKDVDVHVFGTTSGSKGWDEYLKGSGAKVTVHGRVSYAEAQDIMRRSRVVLSSCPTIKRGAHERIFTGMVAGAAVLTNDNAYVSQHFSHGENILLYKHGDYAAANAAVADILADEKRRKEMNMIGKSLVLNHHTWDQRAKVLLDQLTQILRAMG